MADAPYDVIVIGAGIAGLTAAGQCAQQGLRTASVEALLFGGLVINVNELDGEPHGSGTELASNLMTEITGLGVENLSGTVASLARDGGHLVVTTDSAAPRARAVIIASGAKLKRLGIPGEAEFEYKGVSQCADCDGPMFQNEDVVVVGGGDSALQEALVLANYCKRVHVVHRGAKFRARQPLVDAVAARGNIQPVWNTVAEAVLGTQMVNAVRVRNVKDGKTSEIPSAGFFAYIGLEPNSGFVPSEVKRDAGGSIVTNASLQTAMNGVYAAGAVRAGCGGLLTHAIADGNMAAQSAGAALRE